MKSKYWIILIVLWACQAEVEEKDLMVKDFLYVQKKNQQPFSGVCNYFDEHRKLTGRVYLDDGAITKTLAFGKVKTTCTHETIVLDEEKSIQRVEYISCIEGHRPYYVINVIIQHKVEDFNLLYKTLIRKLKKMGTFAKVKSGDTVIIKFNDLRQDYFAKSVRYPDFELYNLVH